MRYQQNIYADRVAQFIKSLRHDAGMTREQLISKADFSVTSLRRWESGESTPSIAQLMEIIDITGQNLDHALLKFRHPDLYESAADASDEEINKLFDEYVSTMSIRDKRHILFAVSSRHGGDRHALMELVSAYLQSPMAARYAIALLIESQYNLSVANNAIQCPNNIQPDMKLLHDAIEGSKDAAMHGLTGYSLQSQGRKEKK